MHSKFWSSTSARGLSGPSGLGRYVAVVAALAMAALLLPGLEVAEASHFRSGHTSWVGFTNGDGNTVDFRIQNSWRRSGYSNRCYDDALQSTDCGGDDGYPVPGDIIIEQVGGTNFDFGDGDSTSTLYYLVDSVDVANDWLFAYALDPSGLDEQPPELSTTIRHEYAEPGAYTAAVDDCCRLGSGNGHVNNSNDNYRVETTVNVGTGNSTPVSLMPPIVVCAQDAVCSFDVPTNDADGDDVRYRLATSQEAGDSGFTQPGHSSYAPNEASVDPDTGTYTWDTTGAHVNSGDPTYYSTQVIVEDLDGDGEPKSKAAVDFFIQLVEEVGDPPAFGGDGDGDTTVRVEPGDEICFDVTASDPNPEAAVTLNVLNLPAGATMTPPLPLTGNPVSSEFCWTAPDLEETGPEAETMLASSELPPPDETLLVTFVATDDDGQQETLTYRIEIGEIPEDDEDVAVTASDLDGDGIPDNVDNCVLTWNPSQANSDGDAGALMAVTDAEGRFLGRAPAPHGDACEGDRLDTLASAGQTVTKGDDATGDDPVVVSVTSPRAGVIGIAESDGPAVDITAPKNSASRPLEIVFTLDESLGHGADVTVSRDGVAIDVCDAGASGASPDPCVASVDSSGGDTVVTVRASKATSAFHTYEPGTYTFE